MKTEGPLRNKLRGWIINCLIFFICYAVTTLRSISRAIRNSNPVSSSRRLARFTGGRSFESGAASRTDDGLVDVVVREKAQHAGNLSITLLSGGA